MTLTASSPNNANIGAPNVPYFTPAQAIPAGKALDPQPSGRPIPKLFQPLKIRGVEFPNRIFLAPLGQNSADNGKLTPWHIAHLGGILTRGPGLTMVEATAVLPEGCTSPEDSGIWSDEHIEPLAQIVQFAHSQNQKIGIQLQHGGRKASLSAPWIHGDAVASEAVGGLPNNVWGPSPVPYDTSFVTPKELNREEITRIVAAFRAAAIRSVKAGVDVLEIHGAHGYFVSSFLSPATNFRTDEYGGTFENRIRFALEVVDAIRDAIPGGYASVLPVSRCFSLQEVMTTADSFMVNSSISATDWLEESLPDQPSWRSEDSVKLAPILFEHGVDLIDVSAGGVHPAQKIRTGGAYQAPFSLDIVRSLDSVTKVGERRRGLVSVVGGITNGCMAEDLLQQGMDVAFVGRQFIKNPGTVWAFAEDLGVRIQLAHQMGWPFFGRAAKIFGEEKESK